MSKKEQEKIDKAERKVQRENQRELIRQQKENFESDTAKMEKEKVRPHLNLLMFSFQRSSNRKIDQRITPPSHSSSILPTASHIFLAKQVHTFES